MTTMGSLTTYRSTCKRSMTSSSKHFTTTFGEAKINNLVAKRQNFKTNTTDWQINLNHWIWVYHMR